MNRRGRPRKGAVLVVNPSGEEVVANITYFLDMVMFLLHTSPAMFQNTIEEAMHSRLRHEAERMREIEAQLKTLPRREILKEALDRQGAIIVTNSLREAYEVANVCAPEHLTLMIREPFAALGHIRNAGAILLGDYSPQTLGDYLAGPSHTLPTSGTARFASPLNVDTFLKKTSVIYYTANALNEVSDALVAFARREGFEAHAEAALARKNEK